MKPQVLRFILKVDHRGFYYLIKEQSTDLYGYYMKSSTLNEGTNELRSAAYPNMYIENNFFQLFIDGHERYADKRKPHTNTWEQRGLELKLEVLKFLNNIDAIFNSWGFDRVYKNNLEENEYMFIQRA